MNEEVIYKGNVYNVEFTVNGDNIEDLIDLKIKDITVGGKSKLKEIKSNGNLDIFYSKIVSSRITTW